MMGITILFLLIIVVFFMFSPAVRKISLATSSKLNIGILGGYMVLLLVSAAIFYFLPESSFVETDRIYSQENHEDDWYLLYENIINKKQVDPVFEKEKRVIEYELEELTLKGNNQDFGQSIVLDKVNELEDTIEVYIYSGKSWIDDIDITDRIPLPSFQLKENTLQLVEAASVNINFSVLKKEFTFSQFTEEKWMDLGTGSSISHSVILIRVPQNLEVNWDELLYVEEIE